MIRTDGTEVLGKDVSLGIPPHFTAKPRVIDTVKSGNVDFVIYSDGSVVGIDIYAAEKTWAVAPAEARVIRELASSRRKS